MITLRRSEERRRDERRKRTCSHTFDARRRDDPLADGFGAVEILDEHRLPPGASVPCRPHHEAEIITYVREGAIAYDDSMGLSGVVQAGEFQRLTAGSRSRHCETNASSTAWAHLFQIWLRPSERGLPRSYEQKRFSAAQRRGLLCVISSTDGRGGSLRIHADAAVCSSLLFPGQHVVHELAEGRRAWLHVVLGELTFGDAVLATGDGVGVVGERALSLTARAESEILLIDLPEPGSS